MTKERRWAKVANKLGYPSGRSVGSILKNHYERILYPFDIFKQGKTLADIVSPFLSLLKSVHHHILNHIFLFSQKIEPEIDENEKKDRDYKPHGIISRQQIKPPQEKFSRRSKRFVGQDDKQNGGSQAIKQEDCKDEYEFDCKDGIEKCLDSKEDVVKEVKEVKNNLTSSKGTYFESFLSLDTKGEFLYSGSPSKENAKTRAAKEKEVSDKENSKELKKLQFYGAGPKMAGFVTKESKKSNKTRGMKVVYEIDPVSIIFRNFLVLCKIKTRLNFYYFSRPRLKTSLVLGLEKVLFF